ISAVELGNPRIRPHRRGPAAWPSARRPWVIAISTTICTKRPYMEGSSPPCNAVAGRGPVARRDGDRAGGLGAEAEVAAAASDSRGYAAWRWLAGSFRERRATDLRAGRGDQVSGRPSEPRPRTREAVN